LWKIPESCCRIFWPPELRELTARVDALEQRMNARLLRELRERMTRIEAWEKTN